MSLLVHELLIGTGGGGSGASNLQTSPSNPVPIASVTVTHSNSNVQVAHLQQSRVVTITSSQSRLTPSDKGSRLANALAGNPPYSYSSNCSQQRFGQSQPLNRYPVSHVLSSSGISSTQSDGFKPLRTLSSSRQTYVLPFVLQDHNYGAPPPPTPPHSPPPPPPPTVSSPQPYSYKVHEVFSSTNTIPSSPKANNDTPYIQSKSQCQFAKIGLASEQSLLTVDEDGAMHISSTSSGEIVATSSSPSIASQIMASMPLHRQQFMPHPKAPIYPSPHIPSPSTICDSLVAQAVTLPSNGGQDTDEESRLSDRSSSVGPSGEETETAPEGEGEEQVQADDSITRCICNFTHDDGYMIQCDRCFVWQHVDCMEIDRDNIPDVYLCEACKPRLTDKSKARALQVRRRQEIRAHLVRVSSSDSEDNAIGPTRNKTSSNDKSQDRKVLKKKKPKPCKENKSNRKQSLPSSKSSALSLSSNNTVKLLQSTEERELKPMVVKSRRRQSTISGNSQSSGEESSSTAFSLDQLRSWIDDYEVAVTNHYSPELRAKVHAARINGISAEFRESTQGALLGHRCRVAPCYDAGPESLEDKILVAATRLQPETAIIEYQGKYTLKSQWNCVQIPPGLPYLPFVLQYNMQKEGLSVCVDARTYGNDARFARRSLHFNAEISHVVERGSVHLYIVACKEIEEEEEIVLPLETAICQQTVPNKTSNFAQTNHNKVDGNENLKKEMPKISISNPQVRKNGVLNKKNVRKPLLTLALPQPLNRTSRRATSSDSYSCDDMNSPTQNVSPMKQRRSSGCGGGNRSPAKCSLKSPSKSPSKTSIEDCSSGESPHQESPGCGDKMDSHKMTREERKIAAYMKAFERMEKAAQRRQEIEKKKVEDKGKRPNNNEAEEGNRTGSADESVKNSQHEKERRKGKKPRGSPHKHVNDYFEDDNNGSSSEGERMKLYEGALQGYSSPPSSSGVTNLGFRFPKTKKALMNEWLNETVDPVLHPTSLGGEMATGVPTCYMRSPSTPIRRGGAIGNSGTMGVVEMVGRSAKKRWLRQAIIDETEPQSIGFSLCSSPNSRPDSPTSGGDYITPLKKRRLARESMSSEQSNTPPSTPVHSGFEEKYSEEMEIDHVSDENLDPDEEKEVIKIEEKDFQQNIKVEIDVKKEDANCYSGNDCQADITDRLTINISQIGAEVKSEFKEFEAKFDSKPKEKSVQVKVKVEDKSDEFQLDSSIKNEGKTLFIENEDTLLRQPKLERNSSSLVKVKEAEESNEQKLSETTSRFTNSRQKTHNNCRNENAKNRKNLDKNKNMQQRKPKISPKLKKRRVKTKKVKEGKKHSSSSPGKEIFKETSWKSNVNQEIKTFTETVSLTVQQGENSENEPSIQMDTTSLHFEDWKTQENKGPKTPDGTPPETPVRDDSTSKRSEHSTASDVKGNSEKTEAPKAMDNQIKDASSSPREQTESKPMIEHSDSLPKCETISISEDCKEDSILKQEQNSISLTSNIAPIKPAAVKRKLSILEYRKRKSICCENELKEDSYQKIANMRSISTDTPMDTDNPLQVSDTDFTENSKKMKAQKSTYTCTSPIVCLDDLTSSPLSPLSPSFMVADSMKMEKARSEGTAARTSNDDSRDVKWNAAPTLLEQQRENLTARLRREFGLCLPEDSQSKLKLGDKPIKEKWNDTDKRYPFSGGKQSPSYGLINSSLTAPSQNTSACGLKPSPKVNPILQDSEIKTHSSPNIKNEHQIFHITELKTSGFNFLSYEKQSSVNVPLECDTKVISNQNQIIPLQKTKLSPSICTSSDFQSSVQCEYVSVTGTEIEGKNSTS